MKTLEQRLFHLFPPADVAKARTLTPASVACPRVGQVRATVVGDDGDEHEVELELSAHRRGGMTLETRSSSRRGQAGEPCAALAAVLLEIARRGLFSSLQDHTPLTLECIATGEATPVSGDDDSAGGDDEDPGNAWDTEGDERDAATTATRPARPRTQSATSTSRVPAWAADLEERRRLVAPVVRTRSVSLVDTRRAAGALVFVLDVAASADASASVTAAVSAAVCGRTATATARHRGSFAGAPVSSRIGSSSHSLNTSQRPSQPAERTSDTAANSPSESASGPPLAPRFGPCIPRATLTALASAWSEHWGTICGDTAMPPAFATCESVWAAEIRPAWSGAPITPYRANEAVGTGMAAIASSTARTPTTVCSSQ
jgi:hypothetical protein